MSVCFVLNNRYYRTMMILNLVLEDRAHKNDQFKRVFKCLCHLFLKVKVLLYTAWPLKQIE